MSAVNEEPHSERFLAAARLMAELRQDVIADLGEQVESWEADEVSQTAQQAYRRMIETWADSVRRMETIAKTLDEQD